MARLSEQLTSPVAVWKQLRLNKRFFERAINARGEAEFKKEMYKLHSELP
jgi:hypothetical protein